MPSDFAGEEPHRPRVHLTSEDGSKPAAPSRGRAASPSLLHEHAACRDSVIVSWEEIMTATAAVIRAGRHGLLTTVSLTTISLAAVLAGGPTAFAQTAQQTPAAVDEIVVTGTRVVRDGYEAPTP